LLRWGLIPSWADDPRIGNRLINARAETVATKPAFRRAFKERRCLLLVDGFFEWQRQARRKQPFYIRLCDGRPFAFAGLWEQWEGSEGTTVQSCTILTTTSNDLVGGIHHRMPVILSPTHYDRWLDPGLQEPAVLQPLLRPYPADEMTAYPVSPRVNSPANDSPECTEPVT
jgi:putative SOS response-associated peptidase YedK